MRNLIAICCLFAACLPIDLKAKTPSTSSMSDQALVIQTVEEALKAAVQDNLQRFSAQLTPDFYMYDGGRRYDAPGIISRLAQLHASGTRLDWHVTRPDVHLAGRSAWIAYINDGSMTNSSGTTARQWLESAFLVKVSGRWRIAFWHSTPVPPKER